MPIPSAKAAIDGGTLAPVGRCRGQNTVMIGERIDIEIDVEAVRQPAAAISFLSDIHDLPGPNARLFARGRPSWPERTLSRP